MSETWLARSRASAVSSALLCRRALKDVTSAVKVLDSSMSRVLASARLAFLLLSREPSRIL